MDQAGFNRAIIHNLGHGKPLCISAPGRLVSLQIDKSGQDNGGVGQQPRANIDEINQAESLWAALTVSEPVSTFARAAIRLEV